MQRLLAELEAARSKAQVAEATVSELQAAQEQGQQVADALAFNEETTRRRLIDSLLVAAGWNVGANGASTEQVGQEFEVDHQPTPSGKGKADYVLWGDNGKPLGVIEAKKTAVDAEAGRTQAKCYADGLEKMNGQRPVIFYTNGYDIWLWNDAAGEPPRKMFGFYSQDSLEYLHYQRANREPLTKTAPEPGHRRAHVPARGDQAGGRAVRRQAPQGADRPGDRHRQDPRRRLALRPAAAGEVGQAHPVPLRPQGTPQAGPQRLQGIPARRAPHLRHVGHVEGPGQAHLPRHLPGDDGVLRDVRRRLLRPHHRRRVAPQHLQPLPRTVRLLRRLQVGLTATPVEFIARNTYTIFGCEDRDPTAYFSFEDAINNVPPYLVPFEVVTHTTPFLRKGIKYSEMSSEQRQQLEEDEDVPAAVEFEQAEVDKAVFNKDTNRVILRNLMENGIRDATGTASASRSSSPATTTTPSCSRTSSTRCTRSTAASSAG